MYSINSMKADRKGYVASQSLLQGTCIKRETFSIVEKIQLPNYPNILSPLPEWKFLENNYFRTK